jgi:hypothetical protein
MTILTFKTVSVAAFNKLEAQPMFGASRIFTAPEGNRYYVVKLLGHLDGLRQNYHFVCKDSKQFVAAFEQVGGDGQGKTRIVAQGVMIEGIPGLGWMADGSCWLHTGQPDEEMFTVAFVLPAGLTRFAIGVVDSKGGVVMTDAVVDVKTATEKR